MSSKLYRFIKLSFFILILFFNKSYTRECIDITSNVNQKLAIQALASQSYLNNLVIRFDESKKKYIDTVGEMKSLTDAIEVGLVDLGKDVQQAIKTERSLIRTASGILEYQYSLNEQAASVVDFLLSAPVKQKQIPLGLDFEFLDDKAKDEVRATINKYNIVFKEGFNTAPEFYTDEIDELLGYVPGDPYATKTALIASEYWRGAYSTSWHPSGNYVVITGAYNSLPPFFNPQLRVYDFDGTSLSNPVESTGTPADYGRYWSIGWSPEGGYLLGGVGKLLEPGALPPDSNIRVFTFAQGPPKTVDLLTVAQYNPGTNYGVTSVAWHPDFSDSLGGYFAVVGNGDNNVAVKEIQIYNWLPPNPLGLPFCTEKWGMGVENYVYSCCWSPDGKYLAVGGQRNNANKVLRVFEFDPNASDPEKRLIERAWMYYNDFDFDVGWITGVDCSPNGQYFALASNFLLPTYEGESPQIAMNAVGNAFAVWENASGLKRVIQAIRYDVMTGFWQDEAVDLSSSDYDSYEPQIAINNNGDAIAVWKKDDGGGSFTIQANKYDHNSDSWQSSLAVTNLSLSGKNAGLPQIAMNDEGAIAVWQGMFDNLHTITIIQANRYDGFNWQDPSDVTNLSTVGEDSRNAQIAMIEEGDAIVTWRSADGGGSYAIKACKYDCDSSSWLSRVNVFSAPFSSIDNPQVAMSNQMAIIIWEGEETYFNPAEFWGKYYNVQARVNIISKGWERSDAWEPNLNKEPEDLSLDSRRPQIAVLDYEGIAVWEYVIPPSDQVIQTKKYILRRGWESTKNLDTPSEPAGYPQIAMDGAGNAIAVWWVYGLDFSGGATARRYNAAADSWGSSSVISTFFYNFPIFTPIVMDRAGNAIAIWERTAIYASRYNEVIGFWKTNLGYELGRHSLKVVKFDDLLTEPLTLLTEWSEVGRINPPYDLSGVQVAKWAPSGKAVAIGSDIVTVNDINYSLIVFEVDFLSGILTLVEGLSVFLYQGRTWDFVYSDLAWRPDGKYISASRTGRFERLDINDLDFDYFEVVVDTFDTSVPARGGTKWSNKGGRDVGWLTNLLCQNQEKGCTKSIPTKFAIPNGYLTAANFVNIINPACISADYGLTAVLDASIEVTNSLLGARTRNCKFMQDNLKLSKRLTDVYKKSIEMKKSEQARVIDRPGVYTFNKDVQGVIVIDADNITLDLNGHKIFSDSKIPITVNKNIKNISIKNGSIIGGNQYLGAPSGVLVKEGAQHITLENLTITFCYEGVTFKGEQDCSVTDCLVEDCAFKSNIKAASLDCSEYVTFKECEFLDCFLETVNLENNNKNCCE